MRQTHCRTLGLVPGSASWEARMAAFPFNRRCSRAGRARQLIAAIAVVVGAGLAPVGIFARAEDPAPAPGEAWKTSPHHGVQSGATGLPIPCICRFRDRDFRLGAAVCMNTHVGTVIARCDLFLNNTTWVPTNEPCTISLIPGHAQSVAVLQ